MQNVKNDETWDEEGRIWRLSVPGLQLFCKSKTDLKIKLIFRRNKLEINKIESKQNDFQSMATYD
jgi:hypothetical protein